jgi:hypothetical protein
VIAVNRTIGVLIAILVAFFAGIFVYDIWLADDDATDTACPASVSDRFTEEELHEAYLMSRGMSRPEAAPMWHDQQLERSLRDPVFVAELEAHFCRMQEMLAEQ